MRKYIDIVVVADFIIFLVCGFALKSHFDGGSIGFLLWAGSVVLAMNLLALYSASRVKYEKFVIVRIMAFLEGISGDPHIALFAAVSAATIYLLSWIAVQAYRWLAG